MSARPRRGSFLCCGKKAAKKPQAPTLPRRASYQHPAHEPNIAFFSSAAQADKENTAATREVVHFTPVCMSNLVEQEPLDASPFVLPVVERRPSQFSATPQGLPS